MSPAARTLALAALLAAGCERNLAPVSTKPSSAPEAKASRSAPPAGFGCVFTDVTTAAGLHFTHSTGGRGDKLLPETLGSGAAFLDFDGDRSLDIFLVSSMFWPGEAPAGSEPPRCALYRGRNGGVFEDVSVATKAGIALYGMGCAPADADGDGDEDIFVTGVDRNALLVNDGGVFRDATEPSGLKTASWRDPAGHEHPVWSTAAAWLDADNDGDLDLIVTGYVQWSREGEIFTTLDGSTKAFTTPDRYRGLPPRLYLNRGDGTFEDATRTAGLEDLEGKSLGIALWDFDSNGLLDAVVANDTRPNFLLRNLGGGRFEEIGLRSGIAYDETGRARAGMGIDIAEISRDDAPFVAIGNFSDEPMSLYRYDRIASSFTSEANRAGLGDATFTPLTFGLSFVDLDLDSALDLVVVNGHIEPDVALAFPGHTHAQSAQAFRGRGDGTFEEATASLGDDFSRKRVGRGLAAGDIDGDGDLDLLMTANGGPTVLLRNDRAPAPANHFLRVRLTGKGKNTRGIGATVRLTTIGKTQMRLASTGSSYLSQSEPVLTFGLGSATSVDKLEVRWPTGQTQVVPVPAVDRTIEIRE